MFDIGFSEVLLIFVIALVVLGPEKLPRLASQLGRWIGRARAMARQFREQLEEEVNLEQVRRAHEQKPEKPAETASAASAATAAGAAASASTTESSGTSTAEAMGTAGSQPSDANASGPASWSAPGSASEPVPSADPGHARNGESSPDQTYQGPDPSEFRADTFSHAHPTNEVGANPHTANGAAEPETAPWNASDTSSRATSASPADASISRPADSASGAPSSLPEANVASARPEPPAAHERTSTGEAYASNTPMAPATATREPARPATEEADTHGQS